MIAVTGMAARSRASRRQARNRGMGMLAKTEPLTFNNGNLQADLDHVLGSDTLSFTSQGVDTAGNPAFIAVRGWNQLTGSARQKFIDEISDHSSLFGEVA